MLDRINFILTRVIKQHLVTCKRFKHFARLRDTGMKQYIRAYIRYTWVLPLTPPFTWYSDIGFSSTCLHSGSHLAFCLLVLLVVTMLARRSLLKHLLMLKLLKSQTLIKLMKMASLTTISVFHPLSKLKVKSWPLNFWANFAYTVLDIP